MFGNKFYNANNYEQNFSPVVLFFLKLKLSSFINVWSFCNLLRNSYQVVVFKTWSALVVSCSLIILPRCIQSFNPSFTNWYFRHPFVSNLQPSKLEVRRTYIASPTYRLEEEELLELEGEQPCGVVRGTDRGERGPPSSSSGRPTSYKIKEADSLNGFKIICGVCGNYLVLEFE